MIRRPSLLELPLDSHDAMPEVEITSLESSQAKRVVTAIGVVEADVVGDCR